MLHSEYNDSSSRTLFFPRSLDYNQNVSITVTPPKKPKSFPSTFRSLLSSMKGRKKEKDLPTLAQEDEYKQYLEDVHVHSRILDTDLTPLVKLPHGLDLHEWLATHTISFFDHINLLYGVLHVSEFCTTTGCPTMSAPGNTQYIWSGEKGRERTGKTRCSAPQYIDYVLTFIQGRIQDPQVFPTKFGEPFPDTYIMYCKKIYRYVFHVMAHMYHAHFKQLLALGLHTHLNLVFQHFIMFARHHVLIDDKETEILHDLYDKLDGRAGLTAPLSPDDAESVPTTSGDGPMSPVTDTDLPPPPDSLMYTTTPTPTMELSTTPLDAGVPITPDLQAGDDHNKENNSFIINSTDMSPHHTNCGLTLPSGDTPQGITPQALGSQGSDNQSPSVPISAALDAATTLDSSADNHHIHHHHHHSNGSATGVSAVS